MIQGILFGVTAVLTLTFALVFSGSRKKHFGTVLKVMVLFYLAWAFFRIFLSDSFIYVINGGTADGIYRNTSDYLQSFLRWGHHISYGVLVIAVLFNNRLLKNISIYFVLPFTILSAIYFDRFMEYFMEPTSRGIIVSQSFMEIYFSIELVLGMLIPLLFVAVERHWFNIKSGKEWLHFFAAIPFVALLFIPPYVPQSLFGYTKITFTALTVGNFFWILITIVEIIAVYLIFRFKEYKHRLCVCSLLAIALFIHFNSMYYMGITWEKLPLHLCNIAAYFFVIALIIKNKAFFNFAFLVNIMGTMIAMVAPDISGGVGDFWNFHFLIEHMQVLAVPSAFVLLRIFPRPGKESLKHLIIGFSIYFFGCLIFGTIFNGHALETEKVNYFYIFDFEKAAEYIPFMAGTERFNIVLFGRYYLYPVYQLSIYGAFLFGCVMLYLGTIKLYKVLDDHLELRMARINLYEKVTGKKSRSQREFLD